MLCDQTPKAGHELRRKTVAYSPQTLTGLAIAENTRIDLADLVASEQDEEALTRAARRTAVDTVLYNANPAPF